MKRYMNPTLLYAILAMVGGVFYREFTKFNGFTAKTTLGVVHTHYFLLGIGIRTVSEMWKYIKRYLPYGILAALFMVGEVLMDLLQPEIMSKIVDDGVLGVGSGGVGDRG